MNRYLANSMAIAQSANHRRGVGPARLRFCIPVLCLCILVCGCNSTVGYKPSYLQDVPAITARKVEGKALILTDTADDSYHFSQPPSSVTGGAMTLNIPLGLMAKEIAKEIFGELFTDGCDTANLMVKEGNYVIVIQPKVVEFDYKYNQLKNAFFAITPQVSISLTVSLFDRSGKSVQTKVYSSGLVDGRTYLISFNPPENINKTAHKVLYDLISAAAKDLVLSGVL